jgi:predicted ArsR family transcriptional regulator
MRGGNIGVLLGPASGDLVAIDIDTDSEVDPFLVLNPKLRTTLRTRGSKGCQIWVRITDRYPASKVSSKKKIPGTNKPLAEWRGGGGHQSVVFGIHPDTGRPYQIVVDSPTLAIAFGDIEWPASWQIPLEKQEPNGKAPEHDPILYLVPGSLPSPDHITAYLDTVEIAVEGQGGSAPTFRVACILVNGFALSREEAIRYMRYYSETRSKPPWSEHEMAHKIDDALKASHQKPRGHLLSKKADHAPAQEHQGRNTKYLESSRKAMRADAQRGAREQRQLVDDTLDEEGEKLFEELLERYESALCTSVELEALPIRARKPLLGRWMKEGDTGFVFGDRGGGKTWLVDAIASHLSTGRDLFEWCVPTAVDVLLVDGEMPADECRNRLKGITPGNQRLHILHHEMLFDRTGLVMNLTDAQVQRVIRELCIKKNIKLLILDNLSCLFSGIKENDADEWEKVLNWLLDLRRRQIAVLIVHHASRSGTMRGTSKREDAAFWVIKVDAIQDHAAPDESGAKFETTFTKQRNSDSPEWTRKWTFRTDADGTISIGCTEFSFDEKVLQLIQSGLISATEIADELGQHKSNVSRAATRLMEKKLIEKNGRGYRPRGS